MSSSFTKLFSTITESTIWGERDPIRLTWITMMAMADRKGRVFGSLPGLAHRARVSLEDALEAIEKFQQPDRFSRTREHDGKRIELIDGGWRLLNYSKYREMRDDEASKEAKREYINERREAEKVAEEATGKKQTKFQKPTIEQCLLAAAKIGLSEQECHKFFNFYESKGWKVGKNLMASWPHAMAGWKSRAAEYSNGSTTPKKATTIFEITKVIEAKTKLADELRHKHASEGPLSTEWSPPEKRSEHAKICSEIKQLNQQIAGMA